MPWFLCVRLQYTELQEVARPSRLSRWWSSEGHWSESLLSRPTPPGRNHRIPFSAHGNPQTCSPTEIGLPTPGCPSTICRPQWSPSAEHPCSGSTDRSPRFWAGLGAPRPRRPTSTWSNLRSRASDLASRRMRPAVTVPTSSASSNRYSTDLTSVGAWFNCNCSRSLLPILLSRWSLAVQLQTHAWRHHRTRRTRQQHRLMHTATRPLFRHQQSRQSLNHHLCARKKSSFEPDNNSTELSRPDDEPLV